MRSRRELRRQIAELHVDIWQAEERIRDQDDQIHDLKAHGREREALLAVLEPTTTEDHR